MKSPVPILMDDRSTLFPWNRDASAEMFDDCWFDDPNSRFVLRAIASGDSGN